VEIALREHRKDSGDLHDADKLVPEAVLLATQRSEAAVFGGGMTRLPAAGADQGLL